MTVLLHKRLLCSFKLINATDSSDTQFKNYFSKVFPFLDQKQYELDAGPEFTSKEWNYLILLALVILKRVSFIQIRIRKILQLCTKYWRWKLIYVCKLSIKHKNFARESSYQITVIDINKVFFEDISTCLCQLPWSKVIEHGIFAISAICMYLFKKLRVCTDQIVYKS